MAFVHTVPVDRASGDVHAMYARIEAAVGYVPNYAKLFSHRPQVMATWAAFLASIRGNMDPRRYELVTLAAARALQCSYCMLAHGAVLRRDFYSAEQLIEITRDSAASDLTPAEVAMMAFVDKLTRAASTVAPPRSAGSSTAGSPTPRSSTSRRRPRPAASSASSWTRSGRRPTGLTTSSRIR